MPYKLEKVYVSIPKAAADVLVNGAHRYSVPTLAATLVCRHFGIDWNPRPNARKLWKLSPEKIELRRRKEEEYRIRSGKHAYVKVSDMSEKDRAEHENKKTRQRRNRHSINGDEVYDLTLDEVHYCRIAHPKEWDSLPFDVRERLLRNMYVRRRQKRVQERIKAANAELRERKRASDELLSAPNLRDVGIDAERNCAECTYYDGRMCSKYGNTVLASMMCDSFRSLFE